MLLKFIYAAVLAATEANRSSDSGMAQKSCKGRDCRARPFLPYLTPVGLDLSNIFHWLSLPKVCARKWWALCGDQLSSFSSQALSLTFRGSLQNQTYIIKNQPRPQSASNKKKTAKRYRHTFPSLQLQIKPTPRGRCPCSRAIVNQAATNRLYVNNRCWHTKHTNNM